MISEKKTKTDTQPEDWLIRSSIVSPEVERGRSISRVPFARISGSASVQNYRLTDNTENGLNFSQTSFRVNLRAQRLFDKALTFRLRTRTRRYSRARDYLANDIPQSEWRNRLYELSFRYHNRNAPVNFSIGRIYSLPLSGIGYFDGAQLQANISRNFSAGILAGKQPVSINTESLSSLNKYGVFLTFTKDAFRLNKIGATLAAVAEYSGSTVSREYVYFQSNYHPNSKFSFFQSLELDINRNWRKQRAGKTIAFSNLHIVMRYRFLPTLIAGIVFDNRRNYYTIEYIDIDDFFFDDAPRTGLRANITTRLPGRFLFYGEIGLRFWNKENDGLNSTEQKKLVSGFSARISRSNFLIRRLSVDVFATRFNSLFSDGFTATTQLGWRFPGGHQISVSYSKYNYDLSTADLFRKNDIIRLRVDWLGFRQIFFNSQLEIATGDDLNGPRFLVELGYLF